MTKIEITINSNQEPATIAKCVVEELQRVIGENEPWYKRRLRKLFGPRYNIRINLHQ